MRHEDAVFLLTDAWRGRLGELGGEARADLAAHVSDCSECRTMHETYRLLSALLRAEAGRDPGDHPAAKDLVAYALDPESLSMSETARIATHVNVCETCSSEAEMIRGAEASLAYGGEPEAGPASRKSPRRLYPNLRAAIAAGIVAALMAYPTYLGLRRREFQRVPVPVPMVLLERPQRGETAQPPKVTVTPGQPYVSLGVERWLATSDATARGYRVEIARSDGTVVLTLSVTAREAERAAGSGSSDLFCLLVPASDLVTGDHELRVRLKGAADSDILFVTRFEVVRVE